jgi:hypothetical protein
MLGEFGGGDQGGVGGGHGLILVNICVAGDITKSSFRD